VKAIEDSIESNEEISSGEEPDMVLDEYGQWVKLVSKRINDGFENGGREKKLCIYNSLFIYEWEK
jgi:regulator of sirC expression with transglutaminase-like and TPR domain